MHTAHTSYSILHTMHFILPVHTCCTLHTYIRISGAIATNLPHFGPGAGFILLDDVDCTGNEANLTQCRHNGLAVHNCVPSEDAGVICSNSTGEYRNFVQPCSQSIPTSHIMLVKNWHVTIRDNSILLQLIQSFWGTCTYFP